jgi:hypothetical protein
MQEYANLFFDPGTGWEIHYYDWNKSETAFQGTWVNAIQALAELAQERWEVAHVYVVPKAIGSNGGIERNDNEEYLLRRSIRKPAKKVTTRLKSQQHQPPISGLV